MRSGARITDRSRAQIDPRWDQEKISQGNLLIIGSGAVGQLAALTAAGLGFRQIVLIGTGEERSSDRDVLWSDLEQLRMFVKARYSDVLFSVLSGALPVGSLRALIGEPDVCLGALDDPACSSVVLDISGLADASRRVFSCVRSNSVSVAVGSFPEQPTGTFATVEAALLGAGLALSEARRLVAPCAEDCELEGAVTLALPRARFGMQEIRQAGAGGTGSLFGLAARFMCRSLHIWDADVVEASNLARCPCLGAVGENKAADLARNLSAFGGRATYIRPHELDAGSQWLDGAAQHCIAAFCTDTLASRRILNSAACRNGIPAVNMGTSLFGATVYAISQRSQCMECRFPDLDQRIAAQEADREHNSCGRRPEAAAAISNMIAAGAAGMIACRLRDPAFRFAGVLQFDAFTPARLWIDSIRPPCECFAVGGRTDARAAA